MKKKKETKPIKEAVINEMPITETLEKNYMPYVMSVIMSRAIPEIDGLKPSHRKLLYTMYRMGLLGGKFTKSANVVGQTMKLNPHGDMAIYETMVRLTRGNETLLYPLVESQGNFGKLYSRDMAFAASRYTEVRLEPICEELFRDINKNTVKFVDNYDGELKEPVLLPSAFPNILVNPNQGIAVGMASNICSFNLKEVCSAVIAYMKNENTDIMKYMKAPDFSGGAYLIYSESEMRNIYETGKGSFRLRSKYTFDSKNNCIEITEIPYTTTIEAIIDKIIDLIKLNKVREISDVRDESDLKGLRIAIDLKRGTDPDKLMNKLFKMTPLQDSFGCNFNILIDAKPMVLGVKDIIREWLKFRINCIKNSLAYDIDKKSAKLHLLNGLKKILLDIDKAVSIIRHTERESDVVPNLMAGFSVDKVQADYIAEIKLRNLNREYIINRTNEIESLIEEIDNLQATLESEEKIKEVIKEDLKRISKKYGTERKTVIISEDEITDDIEEDQTPDYPLTFFVTRENYIKKIPAQSLRASNSAHKLKENDEIIQTVETTNKSEVLFFTDKASVYKMRMNDIADSKVSNMGEYIPSLIESEADEKIVYTVVTSDFSGMMLFGFENGKAAKVLLNNYQTKTNRRKLIGAYSDKSPLCAVHFLPADTEIAAISSDNRALAVNTEKIPLKATKNTQGVQVITLKKNAVMKDIVFVPENGENVSRYRTKNIPASGSVLKTGDIFDNQTTLL